MDPVEYDDDDVFGYMRAKENETVTRSSPLKCSPLIATAPQMPTDDYGVMARQEGNPVPYVHQFYACVLQGIFSLNLSTVGTFSSVNRTGYRNILDKDILNIKAAGGTQADADSPWVLPKDIRVRRCRQTLEVLPFLSGGAKLTAHLTDVTPKLIFLSVLKGGNHPFMNLMIEEDGVGKLSLPALREIMADYADRFCEAIYIGRRSGFMDDLDDKLSELASDEELKSRIVYDTPNTVINQLAEKLDTHIGESP